MKTKMSLSIQQEAPIGPKSIINMLLKKNVHGKTVYTYADGSSTSNEEHREEGRDDEGNTYENVYRTDTSRLFDKKLTVSDDFSITAGGHLVGSGKHTTNFHTFGKLHVARMAASIEMRALIDAGMKFVSKMFK